MSRVLLLTYEFAPFRGGIGRVAEGLAEGALACGLEPLVLAPDYDDETRTGDETRAYRVIRFAGSFCSIVSPRRVLRFAALCRRTIADTRPDVIHGVDPPAQMALTALARAGLVSDYTLTVHGTELLRYRAEPLPRLWMGRGFSRATHVCAVSNHTRELLHREFDVPRARTFTAYPGIAPAWHQAAVAPRERVRAAWGAGEDDFVILTIARVVREKGQDRVITALARVSDALRARTLYVVAGGGPDAFAHELDEAAQSAGVRLLRTGTLPDEALIRACDAADLFAMLSRETPKRLEGLGLTYLESGARGVPSIACDTGGVREAVLDGRTGVVLPALPRADEVAAVTESLANDAARRRSLGENARAHAAGFTYERHAREVYTRAGLLG